MTTLNYNTTADAGTTVEVWAKQAIVDRREASIFEYLKDYSNAIIRQDDEGLRSTYPEPNEGYTMTYHNEGKLIGAGVSGQTSLVGSEEKLRKNSFSYSATFRRHGVARDKYVQNVDIAEAGYVGKERMLLTEWQGRRKEAWDIARMIAGVNPQNKKYGNGAVGAFANITSGHVVDDDTFTLISKVMTSNNAHPVFFSADQENGNMFGGYVMLIDETVAQDMLTSADFSAFIETFFQGYGYENPLAKVKYGKKQNLAIIPVAQDDGFGSPLRPSVIVASDESLIANSGNADVPVGLPEYTTSFQDYTPDGKINFTEFLSAYLTASGTKSTGIACKIEKADGTLVTGITVKLGSTNTTYTINIANASGSNYTPEAGDKIVPLSSVVMGMGGQAYISHQSAPRFEVQREDYGMEQGVGIEVWEGGTVVSNTRGIVNNICLDFVYAS